jgi:hypothetical protein
MDRTPKISDLAEGYQPPNIIVELAGREVIVYKMTLHSFERAVRVAEPYLKEVMSGLLGSKSFMQVARGQKVDGSAIEDELKSWFKEKVGELLITVPGSVMKLVACIMNIPDEGDEANFFWNEVSPAELLDCLERLDELNDFLDLANRLIAAFGYLARRYGINISGLNVVEKELDSEES